MKTPSVDFVDTSPVRTGEAQDHYYPAYCPDSPLIPDG